MSPQYGELRPASGSDRFASLGHPCKFQLVSRLGSVTARHSSSGRHSAALNRGRHLYSAGRSSGWALAHILVVIILWFLCCRLDWPPVVCLVSVMHGAITSSALKRCLVVTCRPCSHEKLLYELDSRRSRFPDVYLRDRLAEVMFSPPPRRRLFVCRTTRKVTRCIFLKFENR